MTRKDLIDILNERYPDISQKDISLIVTEFLEVIKQEVIKGNIIELRGFGTFYAKKRNEKMARNPHTGEKVYVEKRKVPYFKAGTIFKKQVSSGTYFKVTKRRGS